MSSRKRKGYSIGICIVFNEWGALVFQLLSKRPKLIKKVSLGKKYVNYDSKELYRFHEEVVNTMRPLIKEENKAVVVISPKKSKYWQNFSTHIKKGHKWLDRVSFQQFESEANINNADQMSEIYFTEEFQIAIGQAREEESEQIESEFNRILSQMEDPMNILYSLAEIEDFLKEIRKTKRRNDGMLLLSHKFLTENQSKPRFQRIRQLAKNQGSKEKIFDDESNMAIRIEQMGGIVFLKEL